jgi:hypothetical protein
LDGIRSQPVHGNEKEQLNTSASLSTLRATYCFAVFLRAELAGGDCVYKHFP